jgi:VCBS repeat-containing protein
MPIDVDVQSFAEENANITDCNTKYVQLSALIDNPSLNSSHNKKIPVRRSGSWSIEGEEAYNGYYQDFGNISGEVVLTMNGDSCRTAMIATVIGDTFITGFGSNFSVGVVYTLFIKQDAVGGFSVRWPYGASILNQVGTDPNQITEVYIVKLPNGKVFIKCKAFQNTAEIGSVVKEFEVPSITYPDGAQAPMRFTWLKTQAVPHGGTIAGLYSDWEIAEDALYTNLLFSSYNNTIDLYSIQVVLTQAGQVYMRTRYGGLIGGTPIISDWDEAVVELSGIDGGDKYWDQVVLCINANKYGWEGSRKIVDEKGGALTLNGDTKVGAGLGGKWCGLVDGSGDTINTNVGLNRISTSSYWTIEGFFYTTGNSGNSNYYGQALFQSDNISAGNSFCVHLHEIAGVLTGKIRIIYGNGSSYTDVGIVVTPAITPNTLYHIALVKNNLDLLLFVNGVKYTVTSSFTNYQYTGNFRFFRGTNDTNQEFLKGGFTSIRISTIARYTSDFNADLTNPYFKTGNLWWTPKPIEIATDKFVDSANWDKVYHCLNFYGTANSTVFTDESTVPSTVTVVGNAKIGVDSNYSYLLLDGSGDRLTFPTNFNPNIPGWTIDAMVYATSVADNNTIIHIAAGSNNGLHIWSNTSGYLIVDNGLTGTAAGNIAMSLNTFYHITVKNVAGTIYGYVNGVQCLTHTAQSYGVPNTCSIGSYIPTPVHDYTGRIYALRIAAGETSSANFTPKSSTNPYFPTKPKVQNWADTSLLINAIGLETNSTDIRDQKGNAVSVYGDAKIAMDSNGLSYINFDGSGDYLTTATANDIFNFGTGDFNIDFHIVFNSVSGDHYLIDAYQNTTTGVAIALYSAKISVNTSGDGINLTTATTFVINTLYRVTITRESSVLKIFVNGILDASAANSDNVSSTNPISIGKLTGYSLYGNFRLYSLRITKGKALYTSNFYVDLTNPYFPAIDSISDLWLDANDYSKLTIATGVSQINDKSYNDRHATQTTTTAQPALVQNAQNGLMALGLDGSNDYLKVNSYEPYQAFDVFVVAKANNAFASFMLIGGANRIEVGALKYDAGYKDVGMTAGQGTANRVAVGYDAVGVVGNTHLFDFSWDGSGDTISDYFMSFDGTENATVLSSTIGWAAETGLSIGGRPVVNNAYLNGNMFELFFVLKNLSGFLKKKLQGYFAHKWGLTANLPAGHPYKTGFPTEDTRTDDYWYATVLCINATDIIKPTEIVDSKRKAKIEVYGDVKALIDSNNKPYINFDGTGDYLRVTRPSNLSDLRLGNSDFTVEFFVDASNLQSGQTYQICGIWWDTTFYGFSWEINLSYADWYFVYSTTGSNSVNVFSLDTTNYPLKRNKVSHYAVTRTNGNIYLFVDGTLIRTYSIGTTSFYTTDNGRMFEIGREAAGNYAYLNGKLYGLRITKGIARYTENFSVDLTNPYFPKKTSFVSSKNGGTSGILYDGLRTVTEVLGSAGNVGVWVDVANGGKFIIYSDGRWSFDPDGDFSALTGDQTATTSVTYHVSDGVAEDEGTVTVTVTVSAGISFVGSASAGGIATPLTIQLPSGTTTGDIVIVVTGFSSLNQSLLPVVTSDGYTLIYNGFADDSTDTRTALFYKVMGGTPDTEVSVNASNTGRGQAVMALVFRGVDLGSPFDVAHVYAVGFNGPYANSPAITPVTDGAMLLTVGTWVRSASDATTPSGFAPAGSVESPNTYRYTIQTGVRGWVDADGTIDPDAWVGQAGDTSASWIAITLALRPA